MDLPEDHENLDKKEIFELFKDGEGLEIAEAIRKNVVHQKPTNPPLERPQRSKRSVQEEQRQG